MPKRKGRKPPKRHAADMRPAEKEKEPQAGFFYTPEQESRLWNRLEKIVGSEWWIDETIKAMRAAKIPHNVTQLRRKLERARIYPPPVEMKHNEHRECWCGDCAAKRSWPFYYVRDGISAEHHEEKRALDRELLDDPTLAEELKRLEGNSPGVVVDAREARRGQNSGA